VGTWRLVSFAVQDADGGIDYPFGRDAEGSITYTADGRMAVQFGAANRARLAAPDWLGGADAEIAAAARDYFAYCGTYEFHDDTVVHRVEFVGEPDAKLDGRGAGASRRAGRGHHHPLNAARPNWWQTAGGQPRLAARLRQRLSNPLP